MTTVTITLKRPTMTTETTFPPRQLRDLGDLRYDSDHRPSRRRWRIHGGIRGTLRHLQYCLEPNSRSPHKVKEEDPPFPKPPFPSLSLYLPFLILPLIIKPLFPFLSFFLPLPSSLYLPLLILLFLILLPFFLWLLFYFSFT